MATDGSLRDPGTESDQPNARLAEALLRLEAGLVEPKTLQAARAELAAGAPQDAVLDRLLAQPLSADKLGERGGRVLRQRLSRPQPRPGRALRVGSKRLLARLLVRGSFYLMAAAALVVILILLRAHYGFDIYQLGDGLVSWIESLR